MIVSTSLKRSSILWVIWIGSIGALLNDFSYEICNYYWPGGDLFLKYGGWLGLFEFVCSLKSLFMLSSPLKSKGPTFFFNSDSFSFLKLLDFLKG